MRGETREKVRRLSESELRDYWAGLSDRYLSEADNGLSVICYAGMPAWFNRFVDRYQRKAFSRLLRGEDFSRQRVLDIGTGVGRWARWYAMWPGTEVVGIDIEARRLAFARGFGDAVAYCQTAAQGLPFEDGAFEVVNCVTVLQHVDDETKLQAIAEIQRVLRPGGKAIIFELSGLRDGAPNVFPWSQDRWARSFRERGFALRRIVGDQYTPLLRLIRAAHPAWREARSRYEIDAITASGRAGARSRALTALLRLAVGASYPIEEVCRFLPPRLARITGYLWIRGDRL
jgi:SAM-dependent methyltransferase